MKRPLRPLLSPWRRPLHQRILMRLRCGPLQHRPSASKPSQTNTPRHIKKPFIFMRPQTQGPHEFAPHNLTVYSKSGLAPLAFHGHHPHQHAHPWTRRTRTNRLGAAWTASGDRRQRIHCRRSCGLLEKGHPVACNASTGPSMADHFFYWHHDSWYPDGLPTPASHVRHCFVGLASGHHHLPWTAAPWSTKYSCTQPTTGHAKRFRCCRIGPRLFRVGLAAC